MLRPTLAQSKSFARELDSWLEAHHEPPPDAHQEQKEAFQRILAEASAQWVKDWPHDVAAWQWRLDSVARLETSSNEEVERLGEQVLHTLRDYPVRGMLFAPYQLLVAEAWSERKSD